MINYHIFFQVDREAELMAFGSSLMKLPRYKQIIGDGSESFTQLGWINYEQTNTLKF